jgi:hypothetical protein
MSCGNLSDPVIYDGGSVEPDGAPEMYKLLRTTILPVLLALIISKFLYEPLPMFN